MSDPAYLRQQAARARALAEERNKAGRHKYGRPHLLRLADQFDAEAEVIERGGRKPKVDSEPLAG